MKTCICYYLILMTPVSHLQVEYKEMDEQLANLSDDDGSSDIDKPEKSHRIKQLHQPHVATPSPQPSQQAPPHPPPPIQPEPVEEEESENDDPTGKCQVQSLVQVYRCHCHVFSLSLQSACCFNTVM